MSASGDTESFDRFHQVFFDECVERLDELREALGDFQASSASDEALNTIFRAVHSIKAGAGAFKFTRLVEFSHIFENVLDLLRDHKIPISDSLSETMVRCSDVLADLVTAAQSGTELDANYEAAATAELTALISVPDVSQSEQSPSAEEVEPNSRRLVKISFAPKPDLFRHANEPILMIRELRRLGDLEVHTDIAEIPDLDVIDPEACYLKWHFVLETDATEADIQDVFEFVLDECKLTIRCEDGPSEPKCEAAVPKADGDTPQPTQPERSTSQAPAKGGPGQVRVSSIRVDLERVDRLVNMVGELVIAQSMVLQELIDDGSGGLARNLGGIDDLKQRTRELQEGVMAIRMQPVRSIFIRMPRVVREITPKLGKRATLVTEGEATEVDKTIIEELSDPLTHMIRNALDHGLEMPEQRKAQGKPEEGTIRLSAEHRGGRILISVADDGRGLDFEKIRKRAIERGLITADTELTEHEARQLILAPGFSTADAVSDVSGRGVGMDVVCRKVQGLGGRVSVESTLGKGTVVTLALPLTLAVMDGMLVSVCTEKYVIPLTSIIETLRPEPAQLRRLNTGQQLMSFRGAFVPLIYLAEAFNLPGTVRPADKALVVLVETDTGGRLGVVVDELHGEQQVVIKNLDEHYHSVTGIAGATIMGDGRVALILDIDALYGMGERSETGMTSQAQISGSLSESGLLPETPESEAA